VTDYRFPTPISLLSLTAILASAYLLNQIFDRESDERNEKCFYLSRGIFHARTLVIYALVFFVIASLAFKRAADVQRAPLVAALLLSLLYSLPPARLCARPFFDIAANAIGYGAVAYVLGFGAYQSTPLRAIVSSAPYVLLVASTFLHTTILDAAGDKAVGKISTTVFIGERASVNLAATLHVLAVVCALATGNYAALAVTGLSLPVTLRTIVKRQREASAVLVQVITLVVTAAAIVSWPTYAIIVVPLIILSRFYYRRRFGITYPGVRKSV